jgi:hypothetical protein
LYSDHGINEACYRAIQIFTYDNFGGPASGKLHDAVRVCKGLFYISVPPYDLYEAMLETV